jgi:hypothetical protein
VVYKELSETLDHIVDAVVFEIRKEFEKISKVVT